MVINQTFNKVNLYYPAAYMSLAKGISSNYSLLQNYRFNNREIPIYYTLGLSPARIILQRFL